MANSRSPSYRYFIGIDISKNHLDYAVMFGKSFIFHKQIKNDILHISTMLVDLSRLPNFTISKALFCMEQTGMYTNHVLSRLVKVKANFVVETPSHIKNSLGTIRGKYDKIDAIRIAKYAFQCKDDVKLWTPKRPIIQLLAQLSTLRNRMIRIRKNLKTPLSEQKKFFKEDVTALNIALCKQSTEAIKDDILKIDQYIADLINKDGNISHLMNLITSVPCIGPITALQIIITTNEFTQIKDPKKYACYAGIAPFKNESGKVTSRARVSKIANLQVKSLLHTCAVVAVRYDMDLKRYYERKTSDEGKQRMSVLNAVRNKLILRIFACLNQNRTYQKDYINNKLKQGF
jgi:transposase